MDERHFREVQVGDKVLFCCTMFEVTIPPTEHVRESGTAIAFQGKAISDPEPYLSPFVKRQGDLWTFQRATEFAYLMVRSDGVLIATL